MSNKKGFPKGNIPWNKGMKMLPESEETKRKKSVAHLGISKNAGATHPNWKGGITKMKGYFALASRLYRSRKNGNGGSHTLGEWENLKAQYNWTCPCCKRQEPEIKLTADHIIPVSRGGSNNIENIQPLCLKCNDIKFTKIIKYE